jgi:hypothetical protein
VTVFDLAESARRFGNYAWIERCLFETLGRWIATVPQLAVKLHLGAHCAHHAWHAALWQQRLPVLPDHAPDRMIAPPNDELVAFVDALSAPEGGERTIEKLVGVYRVLLPHMVAAYSLHLAHTSRHTDAPTVRALTLVLRDEDEDLQGGEALIRDLIESAELADRAAAHHSRLAQLLTAAGGVAGPGTLHVDARGEHGRHR